MRAEQVSSVWAGPWSLTSASWEYRVCEQPLGLNGSDVVLMGSGKAAFNKGDYGMSDRTRGKLWPILAGTLVQVLALALGCFLGFVRVYQVDIPWGLVPLAWLLESRVGSVMAVFLLIVEFMRFVVSASLRQRNPVTPWHCLFLALFACWTMYSEPLANYLGDSTFFTGVYYMLPWLLSVSPMVRSKAWLGVSACVLFLAVLLSMLVFNGSSSRSFEGFFFRMVS
jgi:hypothetical protein